MLLFKHMLRDVLGDEGADGGAGGDKSGGDGDNGGGDSGSGNDGGAGAVSWDQIKANLSEDLRGDSSLSTITSLEGLAKGYVHAQKAIGKDRIAVPDKHATMDDWQQVFKKLGVPEKVEEYKFKLPEGAEVNDETLKALSEAGHKAGLLPFQMEQVFEKYYEIAKASSDSQLTTLKAKAEEDVNALKKEWGEGYETQTKKANVAFKELLPDEADRKRLIEDGMASHPSVVRLLANAAKFFKEDTFVGHGEGSLGGVTPAEALEKARAIQGNAEHPYRNKSHPNHQQAQKEVQALYKIAFPE